MNNIDFIKKCCEFADGFTYGFNEYTEKAYVKYFQHRSSEKKSINQWALYPLLLQRAIEGVNRDMSSRYIINSKGNDIEVVSHKLEAGWIFKNIDEAKRKALEYVFERKNK